MKNVYPSTKVRYLHIRTHIKRKKTPHLHRQSAVLQSKGQIKTFVRYKVNVFANTGKHKYEKNAPHPSRARRMRTNESNKRGIYSRRDAFSFSVWYNVPSRGRTRLDGSFRENLLQRGEVLNYAHAIARAIDFLNGHHWGRHGSNTTGHGTRKHLLAHRL